MRANWRRASHGEAFPKSTRIYPLVRELKIGRALQEWWDYGLPRWEGRDFGVAPQQDGGREDWGSLGEAKKRLPPYTLPTEQGHRLCLGAPAHWGRPHSLDQNVDIE